MINKCINFKYRKKNYKYYYYCSKLKKEIQFVDCYNCKYKEFKSNNHQIKKSPAISGQLKRKPDSIKKKSNKLAKLERNRTSLFTADLEHCIICGKAKEQLHEVFYGRNRLNSIRYNIVIPICLKCHLEMHKNKALQNEYHKKGQVLFNETYPDLDFIEIFGRNYL